MNEHQPLAALKALIVALFIGAINRQQEGEDSLRGVDPVFSTEERRHKRTGGAEQHLEPLLGRVFRGGEKRRMRSFRGTIVTMVTARRGAARNCAENVAAVPWAEINCVAGSPPSPRRRRH